MNNNYFTSFIPWKGQAHREVPRFTMELFTIGSKHPLYLATDGLQAQKKPFLSIPSPGGTIRMFLSALQNNSLDEARGYISKYFSNADMEEIQKLIQCGKGYQCYFNQKDNSSVSVAIATESNMDIISMDIVNEPNNFGKWKIWRIIKE